MPVLNCQKQSYHAPKFFLYFINSESPGKSISQVPRSLAGRVELSSRRKKFEECPKEGVGIFLCAMCCLQHNVQLSNEDWVGTACETIALKSDVADHLEFLPRF